MTIRGSAYIAALVFVGASQLVGAQEAGQMLTVAVAPDGAARVMAISSNGPASEMIDLHATLAPRDRLVAVPPPGCDSSKVITTDAAQQLVKQIADEEGFDQKLAIAVSHAESRFHMEAVSPKGAIGLMQLLPATATRFGVNVCDAADNVRGGIRYLKFLQERYKNPLYTLAAYNAGEDAVDRNRGIPPFPETVQYVAEVLNQFYSWPDLGDTQAAAKGARHQAAPVEAQQTDVWSQGFVMHVESAEK